jgi:hypothetical protein
MSRSTGFVQQGEAGAEWTWRSITIPRDFSRSPPPFFFLNRNGLSGTGSGRPFALSEIVVDPDFRPHGPGFLFKNKPGGVAGGVATFENQIGKMPAGFPADALLEFLGKILTDSQPHRFLEEWKSTIAFGIFHPDPASRDGADLQIG